MKRYSHSTQKVNLNKKLGICVVTYPRSNASVVPLLNLVRIISTLSGYFYLITGNEGKQVINTKDKINGYSFDYKLGPFILARVFTHIILQIRIAFKLMEMHRKIDIYLFYMGEGLILPMLMCKVMRKPVLLSLAGSLSRISEDRKDCLTRLFALMEDINYVFADKIVVYSRKLISEWGLQRYSKKICVAHEHFIDFNKFEKNMVKSTDIVIGYVGRLSEEKGIINLIKAIPLILQVRNDIHFLIAGDGQLKPIIEKFVIENKLQHAVKLLGWINHDGLPEYFNELQLLVIPSYTEGLPNVMLEAMACNTPVLATGVGAIPDIIKDGYTGFIMEDNSPECISRDVLRALLDTNIQQIAHNGYTLVRNEFTYRKATETYKKILDAFVGS